MTEMTTELPVTPLPVSPLPVSMSASAAVKIKAIMAKQGIDQFLRVAVNGGGCSGFQYEFGFSETANDDDLIIERDGARIVVDEISLEFLSGSEIDYVNELIGAAFKIHNPNATANCGCGTSFSI
ncbi:MAG: iron-sulfur cluster insertion protein ErpA [Robiginitomaculum sp.]